MKIKKAKLKQIIQEELQKLSEQKLNEDKSTAAAIAFAKDLRYAAQKARGEMAVGDYLNTLSMQDKRDLVNSIPYRELPSYKASQEITHDPADPPRPLYDVPSGEEETEESVACGEETYNPTHETCIGGTVYAADSAEAAQAQQELDEPASSQGGGRRIASDQMRKNINKAWKAGLFGPYEGGKKGTASRKVWADARRALYKSTDKAAAILAAAGVDANTGEALAAAPSADPTVGIQPSPGPYEPAAPDVAGATTPAVAKSVSRQLGPGVGDLERDMLKLKKGLEASELSQSGQERYQALRNTFLDQGEEPREASMKARRRLKSQIANRVTKRSDQRRLAKQYFERFKNQGLDDSEAVQLANSALKGRGEPLNTPPALRGGTGVQRALAGRPGDLGRPGQFEESLDRLTKIVEEEFDKVLAEKEKKTTVSGDVPTHTIKYKEEGGYMHAIATTTDGIVGRGKAKIRSNRKDMARTAASVRARVALVKAAKKKAAVAGTGKTGDN